MYKFRISKNYTVLTKTKSKIEARQVWAAAVQQAKEEELFDYISVKEAGGEPEPTTELGRWIKIGKRMITGK